MRAPAFVPAHMDGLSRARQPEDTAGENMRVIYARHKRAGARGKVDIIRARIRAGIRAHTGKHTRTYTRMLCGCNAGGRRYVRV